MILTSISNPGVLDGAAQVKARWVSLQENLTGHLAPADAHGTGGPVKGASGFHGPLSNATDRWILRNLCPHNPCAFRKPNTQKIFWKNKKVLRKIIHIPEVDVSFPSEWFLLIYFIFPKRSWKKIWKGLFYISFPNSIQKYICQFYLSL